MKDPTWRPKGLSKCIISRVVSTLNGVTLTISLLITDLLSPLGLQVWIPLRAPFEGVPVRALGFHKHKGFRAPSRALELVGRKQKV